MKKRNLVHYLIGLVILAGSYTVVRHFYLKPSFADGEKAPDFIGMLPDGMAFKLSSLKGQYVLLDFWGSWCGPCIAESPALIQLYGTYSKARFKEAEGFAIVSVAIEKDKARWVNAIQRYELFWPYHLLDPVSNLKFFDSPIANQYGVKQLPTKFLINEKGVIIKTNPSLEEVDLFLKERVTQ
jgi:thiol-disulfide isomerase/thioredoxin